MTRKKIDVNSFFAPERQHRRAWLEDVPMAHRKLAFELRDKYDEKVGPSLSVVYKRYFELTGMPKAHSSFYSFMRDDGTKYPEAKYVKK